MKKNILIAALVAVSFVSKAQVKDSTKVDINQVPLLTISDIDRMDKTLLQDIPARYTDAIREYMRQIITARLQALQPKEQPKTEPIKKK